MDKSETWSCVQEACVMFLHMSCNFSLFICSADFFFHFLFSSISFYLSVSLTTITSSLSGIKAESSIPEKICLFMAQDRKGEYWDMICFFFLFFWGGGTWKDMHKGTGEIDTLFCDSFSWWSRNMPGSMKTVKTWMNMICVNLTL